MCQCLYATLTTKKEFLVVLTRHRTRKGGRGEVKQSKSIRNLITSMLHSEDFILKSSTEIIVHEKHWDHSNPPTYFQILVPSLTKALSRGTECSSSCWCCNLGQCRTQLNLDAASPMPCDHLWRKEKESLPLLECYTQGTARCLHITVCKQL